MKNTIVDVIELLKGVDENINSDTLFEKVKGNDKLLKMLCDAAFNTYDNIIEARKLLG